MSTEPDRHEPSVAQKLMISREWRAKWRDRTAHRCNPPPQRSSIEPLDFAIRLTTRTGAQHNLSGTERHGCYQLALSIVGIDRRVVDQLPLFNTLGGKRSSTLF
ncbi:hypothetical protein RRG08_008296 [Elysia crispata]|uniref:Uncharacterized protein n=1 Tax=Elysia crispata TaxID=231223 RepID=A0AAE0ZM94_9GAST|nr:hypothetical protein RRG08_008296 [Elysia crispata]